MKRPPEDGRSAARYKPTRTTDRAHSILAGAVKRGRRRMNRASRQLTQPLRMLPSTLIIGSQKAGTTSLYHYIAQHPLVHPPTRKEVRYFHRNYGRGMGWYRSHFPLRQLGLAQTLEASTGYFDNLWAPSRVATDLPRVRIIVLIREPVARAWSHYRHSIRLGVEHESFSRALALESRRLAPLLRRLESDPTFYSSELAHFSYQRRGRYSEHLQRWFRFFDRERFLVVMSDDLLVSPAKTMESVWEFLDLPVHESNKYLHFNAGSEPDSYHPSDLVARQELKEYFEPLNEQLEQLLGRSLEW